MDFILKYTQKNKYHKKAFFYALAVAFLIFIPFIIYDKGLFLYYGDFNVQQIPFYQIVHDSIRSGHFFWNFNTDLGANQIASYSFYLLTSPFFLITLPFDSTVVPYLMGPLLILKIACASLTAFIYLKRYVVNQNLAVLGGLLYAFSGFSVYNIFFNHFHEAIIVFPLLLWALDEFVYNKRRFVFAVMVFISCFINYYFFVGQAVFLIIYWLVKMFFYNYNCSLKEFFLLLFEAILGVLLSSLVFIPTIICIVENPRVNEFPQGFSALLYSNVQRYLHIAQSMFFPPDIPARPNFTPDSNAKWASVAAWLPLFGMCGTISFLQAKKNHWLKRLIIILLVMTMIPILNSSFQLFNAAYYARWFYMLTLMFVLSTILALSSSKTNWQRGIKYSLYITLAIALPIGFMPKTVTVDGVEQIKIGLMNYGVRFWLYVLIALVSIAGVILLFKLFKTDRKNLYKASIIFVMTMSIIYSTYLIGIGKAQSYDTHNFIIPHCINAKDNINLPDTKNCRSDFYSCMDNMAMFWQIPSIQAFHSIVPGSVMQFYPTIGVKRDVASRPDTSVYGLRALTSCRWLFDYKYDNSNFTNFLNEPQMPGWKYYDSQNDFDIWENEYYIPYGFYYNYYITRSQYDGISEQSRHLALLKAMVIEDKDIEKYARYLKPVTDMSTFVYTENAYKEDCNFLRNHCCYYFDSGKNAFTAKIDLKDKEPELVFFSIPYEKGFSAKVNGEPTEIIKANVGFMAVLLPGNTDSTIEFTYRTPGLMIGLILSAVSLLIFIAYFIYLKRYAANSNASKNRKIYRFSTLQDYHTLMDYKAFYGYLRKTK